MNHLELEKVKEADIVGKTLVEEMEGLKLIFSIFFKLLKMLKFL